MEKQATVGGNLDIEQPSESDVRLLQVTHLHTHGPVCLLPASDQGGTDSMDRVARPAPRTTLPDLENATGSKEMETFYISPRLGYPDAYSGQVRDDGGTQSKDLLCSPTQALARPPPHRFRPKDDAPLDSTTHPMHFTCAQPGTDSSIAGFDGSQRTHTAVEDKPTIPGYSTGESRTIYMCQT